MRNSYLNCNALGVPIVYCNTIHHILYSLDSPQLLFVEVGLSLYISHCSFWPTNVILSYAQATSPMPPRLMHELTKKQTFELIANPVIYPTLCQMLFCPNAASGECENKNDVKAEEKIKIHLCKTEEYSKEKQRKKKKYFQFTPN